MSATPNEPSSPLILNVGDDESVRYARSCILSNAGYRIVETTTGEEALLRAVVDRPDLIVLDVSLPDIDGLVISRRLKDEPQTSHIMVLQVSSARSFDKDLAVGSEGGADGYLTEPVEPVELLAAVRSLLRLAEREKDNQRLIRQLNRTERLLTDATSAAGCGLWDWHIPSGKLEWFGAHERLAGMPSGGFSGKIQAFTDILYPDDRERVWKKVQETMDKREERFSDEYRFVHSDGSIHWMAAEGRFFYDNARQPVRMTGVVQDITVRKQTEDKLKQYQTILAGTADGITFSLDITDRKRAEDAMLAAHDTFRHLVEQSPFGVYAIDADFRLVQISAGAQKVFENVRPLLGRDFAEVLRLLWPEPFAGEAIARFRHTLETGEPYRSPKTVERRQDIDEVESYDWKIERVVLPDGRFGVVCHFYDLSERQRYEQQLAAARQQLQATLSATEIGVWHWDLTDNRLVTDGNLKGLFGVEGSEDLPAEDYTRRIHPDDFARNQTAIDRILQNGGFYDQQFRVIRPDETVRWLHSRGKVETGEGGRRSFVGVVLDITKRRQAEEQLRHAESRFRSMADSAPVLIWQTDSSGIIFVNRHYLDFFGQPVEAIEGMGWATFLHPDDREYLSKYRSAYESRTGYEYQCRFRRVDGEYRWLKNIGTPHYGPDGLFVGFIGCSSDVTDIKQAEDTLRESESRFRQMADNAPVMVWVTETDGRCSFLSRSWYEFTGQTPETGLEFGWLEATHPNDRASAEQTFLQANENQEGFRIEYRLRGHNGEYRWMIDSAAPRLGLDGRFLGYIGSVIDITERKQAEEVLRESEERFRQLSTSLPLLAWTCSSDGACDFLSRQWVAYTGIPESDQLGYGWLDQLHPDDRAHTMQAWEAAVQADSDFHVEFRIRRHDGLYRWFETKAVRTWDAHGRALKWYGFNTDITQRKWAEEALRDSEERFRTLADNMSQFAWMADEKGWIFWYNQRWFEYTGTTLEDMQGWGWEKAHHPDHLHRVIKKWRHALETGHVWEDTFPLRGQDGRYRWFLSRAMPIRDTDGHILRWFGTNTDVTDLREAEQAQAHLAAIVTSSDDAIISKDLDGVVTSWNQAAERLFGYTAEEAVGRSVTILMPPEHLGEEPDILKRIRQGGFVQYETIRRRKDGTLLDISLTVSPIKDEEGQIIGASKVARDITERRRQEEELRRLKEELEVRVQERTAELLATQGRLMTVTSQLSLTEQRERRKLARDLHDYLAQMLIVGQMKTSALKKKLSPQQDGATPLQDLDKVFRDALGYTRTLIAELSPPSLHNSGLPAALKWLGERFEKDGLSVDVRTDCDSAPLSEERAVVVFQAVRELLFNVLKHASVDRATIAVSLDDNGMLRVAVADEGKGLSSDALQRSAEPGHLGLASIRERVQAMGGRVDVESLPGQGTTVTLSLPSARREAQDIQNKRDEETSVPKPVLPLPSVSRDSRPVTIRVLLVDDHQLMRQGLRDLLASDDRIRVVGEAGTCEEALMLAPNLAPDVVVTDINLPGINGIQTTKLFKTLHPQIVVIGLSAHTEEHMKQDILSAGAETLLSKEFAADELIPTILKCYDERAARQ